LAFTRAQESGHPLWSRAASDALAFDSTQSRTVATPRARRNFSLVALLTIVACAGAVAGIELQSRAPRARRPALGTKPAATRSTSVVPHSKRPVPANPTARDTRGYNVGPGCSDDPKSRLQGCSDAPTIPPNDIRQVCSTRIVVDATTTTCVLGDAVRAAADHAAAFTVRSSETGITYAFRCLTGGAGTSGETICEATGRNGDMLYVRW
jgi:hypothetical protein